MRKAILGGTLTIACFAAGLLLAGCGKNLAGPGVDILLGVPQNLKAVSVDSTHVRISWSASVDTAKPDFAGYSVSWGSVADTVSATTQSYLAGPLPAGVQLFTLRSRKTGGEVSDPVSMSWAPASRFDTSPLVLLERDPSTPDLICGIHAGSQTTNPAALSLVVTNQPLLDFFLEGLGGQPLVLRSASEFQTNWKLTLFSTQSDSSLTLDLPLSAYPPDATFTLTDLLIKDNTIYYAQIRGDTGETLALRFHVHILPGVFPNRSVEIRLSLQRLPGVPYAFLTLSNPRNHEWCTGLWG
jgi:hypothetical protein